MTGCLLDDLPQAVPRSGMGALIAAQGGRGFGGGHEPGLCRYPLRPAGVDEARGIREPDLARAPRPAQDQLVC